MALEEGFGKKLTDLGVSPAAQAVLEEQELTSEAALSGLTTEQYLAIGVKLGSAKILADNYGPKQAAVGTPAPVALAANAEVPAGQPSNAEINDFAKQMGIQDAGMFQMFMMAQMGAGMGVEFDISSMIPVATIVGSYSPKKKDMAYMVMSQIEKRLQTPIVVIDSNGKVMPALTAEYVKSLEEYFDPAEDNIYIDATGMQYQIIAVGVDAQSVYDSDPLESTRAIRDNGIGRGRIRWNGVDLSVRQLVFLAVTETGEMDPGDNSQVTWLRDHIKAETTRMDLASQFPKANVLWNEKSRSGSLPNLRVQISQTPRRQEVMPRRRATSPRQDLNGGGSTGAPFRNE